MKKYSCLFLVLAFISFPFTTYSQNILSAPTSTESQCISWLKDKNANQELIDLVPFIFKESIKAGVDPTLVIVQTSLETNFFKSEVCNIYNNTAGIKDRYNSNKYAKYNNHKEGLKAQIGHLSLYAGNPQDWYYYKPWIDGISTEIEGLSGVWAEDKNYSNKILKMMNEIYTYENECIPLTDIKPVPLKRVNKIYEILNRHSDKNLKGIGIINKILGR